MESAFYVCVTNEVYLRAHGSHKLGTFHSYYLSTIERQLHCVLYIPGHTFYNK